MEIQWFVLYAPNCALDPLGYHCVTCKRGGDITTRYNTLHNMVYNTLQQAGLSAHLEVGCGWGQDNSRTRPADIFVTNWDCGTSAAFDITVTSPLNSINMLEAGMYQGVLAKAAEHRKHTQNDPKCVELGWQCILLAAESYGAWGQEALRPFSQVATQLAIRGNTPKYKVVAEQYGCLSLLLVRANARSILVHLSPNTSTMKRTVYVVVLCICVLLCVFCQPARHTFIDYNGFEIEKKKKSIFYGFLGTI